MTNHFIAYDNNCGMKLFFLFPFFVFYYEYAHIWLHGYKKVILILTFL